MADDQANSGGALNPFEENVPDDVNESAVVDSTAKFDEIKKDVIKKRRRRGNRRKKVFGGEGGGKKSNDSGVKSAEVDSDVQLNEPNNEFSDSIGDSDDDFPDEPPVGIDANFSDDEPPTVPQSVPPREEEPLHKEDKLKEEEEKEAKEEKKLEDARTFDDGDVTDDYGEPVNPFAAPPTSENAAAIDTKALEDKPLDRRSDAVEFSPFEERPISETPGFSDERVDETSGVEENFFAEKDDVVKEGDLAEAEIVNREETPEFLDSVDAEPKSNGGHDFDVQDFKKDFWSVLAQAGITKKHLIGFGVFFAVIIFLILFFVFGGMNLFESDGIDAKDNEKVVENNVVDGKVPESSENAQFSEAYGLVTSYLVGQRKTNQIKTPIVVSGAIYDTAGIDSALLIGIGERADKIRYNYYIGLLRRLLNIYQTDVYALLDLSLDRRQAISTYLQEMNQLIGDADRALVEINAIMSDIDARFERVGEDKNFFEIQYFATTEALLAESSYNNLMEYVRVTGEADELKGFYNAYSFLRDMYNNALLKIKPRYKDIVLNRDAVVAGIRVFDVPSSDIKAIIRLSE